MLTREEDMVTMGQRHPFLAYYKVGVNKDGKIQAVELDIEIDAGQRRPPEQVRVLDALSTRSARGTADVARRSGLAIAAVEGVLGILGLEGAVREGDSGWKKVP
jgi:DNA processing protein